MRWLMSEAATIEGDAKYEEKVMLVSDVSRAFFEAPATRNIAVTLPDEALAEAERGQGMVWGIEITPIWYARCRSKLPKRST